MRKISSPASRSLGLAALVLLLAACGSGDPDPDPSGESAIVAESSSPAEDSAAPSEEASAAEEMTPQESASAEEPSAEPTPTETVEPTPTVAAVDLTSPATCILGTWELDVAAWISGVNAIFPEGGYSMTGSSIQTFDGTTHAIRNDFRRDWWEDLEGGGIGPAWVEVKGDLVYNYTLEGDVITSTSLASAAGEITGSESAPDADPAADYAASAAASVGNVRYVTCDATTLLLDYRLPEQPVFQYTRQP